MWIMERQHYWTISARARWQHLKQAALRKVLEPTKFLFLLMENLGLAFFLTHQDMRARGARVSDITIIVVAADDGVRPQTNEAIAHAKAARVPNIIAINKVDKDGANPDQVMQELSSVGLMPEMWGGNIPMVQISALKGNNVDELLETVMLDVELQELKANPHRNAKDTVIVAGLDKSRGPVTTIIVQNATLKKGDIVVCGEAFGKVKFCRTPHLNIGGDLWPTYFSLNMV